MSKKDPGFSSFYRDVLLPRYVFIPFLISRIILEILNIFTFYRFRRSPASSPLLCLEAGIKGWDLIEYKEVLASAEEYLGKANVRKIVIDRSLPYVEQVRQAVCEHRPTHYVYDSRTGREKWLSGLVDSFRIAMLFQFYGVVPICVLTDLPVRAWRAQTAVVSARRGVVVSLMSPRDVMPIFPHSRILGPQLMAFSSGTLTKLIELDAQLQNKFVEKSLVFTGSLYEPRTSLLECVQRGLAPHGINLEIKGRALGSRRFSDDDYWRSLGSATMVITTANLCEQTGVDWPWVSHLIYRYLEVPAVGSVLVAQEVPGLRRYLLPDVHYICYATPEEAVEKIAYYWNHPEALERIAIAGREKIRSLIRSSMYWICVDTALQSDSLIG
jgi:hypothetical protein